MSESKPVDANVLQEKQPSEDYLIGWNAAVRAIVADMPRHYAPYLAARFIREAMKR